MNEIVMFEPEHLIGFDNIELPIEDAIRDGTAHKKLGPAYTIMSDGVPACCFGAHMSRPEVGIVWMYLSKSKAGPSVLKCVRDSLELVMQNYRRLSAVCLTGSKFTRTLEFLGFQLEGVMRQIGPDFSDRALWSRIR